MTYAWQPYLPCRLPHVGCKGLAIIVVCLIWLTPHPADGGDIHSLIFRGADYHYNGELDKAIVLFEEAITLDPDNEFAHNQLGVLYGKKERFSDALAEFSRAVAIDGRNTTALLWLGILHLRDGNLNIAFKSFNRVIQVDPNNADAYYYLGAIYNFRHNPVMAIEYLKKSRDADSEEADTHFRLAKAFHNVDMTTNALLEYNRTIDLNPGYTKAINEIGWIFYNRGDEKSAIEQWLKTLRINRNDIDAIYNLAKAYNDLAWSAYESNNVDGAKGYWEKTLAINPGNKAAKFYLKKISSK